MERIGGGENRPLQGHLMGLEPEGVAAAVGSLVVGEDPVGDLVEPVTADQQMTRLGMLADPLPLMGVERAGLLEERPGDRDLADVVQHSRKAEPLAHELGEAETERGLRRQVADGQAMLHELGVPVAQALEHPQERSGARLLRLPWPKGLRSGRRGWDQRDPIGAQLNFHLSPHRPCNGGRAGT